VKNKSKDEGSKVTIVREVTDRSLIVQDQRRAVRVPQFITARLRMPLQDTKFKNNVHDVRVRSSQGSQCGGSEDDGIGQRYPRSSAQHGGRLGGFGREAEGVISFIEVDRAAKSRIQGNFKRFHVALALVDDLGKFCNLAVDLRVIAFQAFHRAVMWDMKEGLANSITV